MLGERLFNHWLLQDLGQAKISRDALPFASMNEIREYCERQVFPLLEPMRSRGPEPGILSGTDERSLDAHTGFMLYVDATYGSRALMELLEYLPPSRTNTPQGIDFLVAFITWTREEPVQTIALPNSGSTMIYLSRGEFIIRRNAGKGKLALNGAAIQGSDSEWTIRVVTPGWRTLTLTESDSTRTLRIQRRAPG
jgi:hypothetical protein